MSLYSYSFISLKDFKISFWTYELFSNLFLSSASLKLFGRSKVEGCYAGVSISFYSLG